MSGSAASRVGRALSASIGGWGAVAFLHAAAAYSDQIRRGGSTAFAGLLGGYALAENGCLGAVVVSH